MKFNKYTKFIVPSIFLAFIFICSSFPTWAEWYMRLCYPAIATIISFFSRLVFFSLFDCLIITAIFALAGSMVMMFKKKISFKSWSSMLLLSVLWIIVWFYMSWGIAYFRPGFYARFEVEKPKEDSAFFEALVVRYIDSLNRAYVSDPYFDAKEINDEIETLFAKHHELLRLPYPCGWRRTKKTITNPLMTRMGIAGYFAPFFNEVKVNSFAPPLTYPYTLAHEKAHQLGIASEAECNLIATFICISSSHPLVRYSGYLQTASYLLGSLRRISPERYREIIRQVDPHVLSDFRAIREHWQKELNPMLSALQEKAYDIYLKTNKQPDGVAGYSEMTELLIVFEKFFFNE